MYNLDPALEEVKMKIMNSKLQRNTFLIVVQNSTIHYEYCIYMGVHEHPFEQEPFMFSGFWNLLIIWKWKHCQRKAFKKLPE